MLRIFFLTNSQGGTSRSGGEILKCALPRYQGTPFVIVGFHFAKLQSWARGVLETYEHQQLLHSQVAQASPSQKAPAGLTALLHFRPCAGSFATVCGIQCRAALSIPYLCAHIGRPMQNAAGSPAAGLLRLGYHRKALLLWTLLCTYRALF